MILMKYTLHTHDSSSFGRRVAVLRTSLNVMEGEATCHKALTVRYLDDPELASLLHAASPVAVDLNSELKS